MILPIIIENHSTLRSLDQIFDCSFNSILEHNTNFLMAPNFYRILHQLISIIENKTFFYLLLTVSTFNSF